MNLLYCVINSSDAILIIFLGNTMLLVPYFLFCRIRRRAPYHCTKREIKNNYNTPTRLTQRHSYKLVPEANMPFTSNHNPTQQKPSSYSYWQPLNGQRPLAPARPHRCASSRIWLTSWMLGLSPLKTQSLRWFHSFQAVRTINELRPRLISPETKLLTHPAIHSNGKRAATPV